MSRRGSAIIVSVLAVTFFSGCSGVTAGFDEDSPFYSKPATEPKVEKADETPKSLEKEAVVTDETPKNEIKEKVPDEENETTTFYDPENTGD